VLCCCLVVLAFFFIISETHCDAQRDGTHVDKEECFNVTVIFDGLPMDLPRLQGKSNYNTNLCGEAFENYCQQSQKGSAWIYAALGGVFLIIMGLVHYLMCLTANYALIKDGAKLREFEDAKFADAVELRNIMEGTSHPSSYYQ